MIETLKKQLRLSLHRQFGRRNEFVNVDQLGLFAVAGNEDSTVIQVIWDRSKKYRVKILFLLG